MNRKRRSTTTLALAMALPLGLQTALLGAQEQDLAASIEAARPQVELADNGLFVEAPAIAGLVTLNVRVFNEAGELVFSTRSKGEVVQLLATDLPDGHYRYETVTVFTLTQIDALDSQAEREGISRNYGTFFITNGALVVEQLSSSVPLKPGSALLKLAAGFLSVLVPDAQAQDVTINDTSPAVIFNDTDIADGADWVIEGSSTWFRIFDSHVDAGGGSPIIIDPYNSNSSDTSASFRINPIGDLTWANGGMFFDKSTQELAIGTTETPSDLNLYSVIPDIRLEDESDGSWFDIQYDAGFFELFADIPATVERPVLRIDVNAPTESLLIESDGAVSSVTSFTAPLVAAFDDEFPALFVASSVGNSLCTITEDRLY